MISYIEDDIYQLEDLIPTAQWQLQLESGLDAQQDIRRAERQGLHRAPVEGCVATQQQCRLRKQVQAQGRQCRRGMQTMQIPTTRQPPRPADAPEIPRHRIPSQWPTINNGQWRHLLRYDGKRQVRQGKKGELSEPGSPVPAAPTGPGLGGGGWLLASRFSFFLLAYMLRVICDILGRISWLRRVHLENPLGRGDFFSGLKLSGERDGGLGLARFLVVCPLGGHMHFCTQMAFYGTQVWQVLHVWA
jgi:hypothetical protein